VQQLREARCVVVTGQAGAGKSALLAALARTEVTQDAVPPGFLHAVAFLSTTITSEELAGRLAWQLSQSVEGFGDCLRLLKMRMQAKPAEWAGLDSLHGKVILPLRMLKATGPVRIAIDALDQVPDSSLSRIVTAVQVLATDPALAFVRVVVSARPDTAPPQPSVVLPLSRASEEALRAYFVQRRVPGDRLDAAVRRAGGNWLVAKLLADLAEGDAAAFDPAAIPAGLGKIYDRALQWAGAGDRRRWREGLRPVLTVLAVAGTGPVLPFALFRRACKELGGPGTNSSLRDMLVDLRGLVARAKPGAKEEQVGFFHSTMCEHLLRPGRPFSIETEEGHCAVLAAIEELAPAKSWDAREPGPEQRYAFERHAEHLWALGRCADVVNCLQSRTSNTPSENLNLWAGWLGRCDAKLGKDHADTLHTRSNIAHWTGESGDGQVALRLFGELLLDLKRVLGRDDPLTLRTRNNIARWTGKMGNAKEALRLASELLPDRQRVLGPDHHQTLRTRHSIAHWTGEAGDPREALRLASELLPDRERVLGPYHHDTLITRYSIARWTGEAGDAREALRLFGELLPGLRREFGPDHPYTLMTRDSIARWTGDAGDPREALRLASELLPDRKRVLGPYHPDTLTTRYRIAIWAAEIGEDQTALRLLDELLPDFARALGPGHPLTIKVRKHISDFSLQHGN
jgi:hypothetical protein